jgi:ferredoxin
MSNEGKKVTIDGELCIGCQHCVELCPEIFKYNAEKGVAEAGVVSADCKCDLEAIAGECPGSAIVVE